NRETGSNREDHRSYIAGNRSRSQAQERVCRNQTREDTIPDISDRQKSESHTNQRMDLPGVFVLIGNVPVNSTSTDKEMTLTTLLTAYRWYNGDRTVVMLFNTPTRPVFFRKIKSYYIS